MICAPQTELPQVVIRISIPAGSAADPAEAPGTAALVGDLLTEGTERWSAEEINTRLDELGAALSVDATHDFVEIEALLLSETVPEAVEVLAEVITRPTFPRPEVDRVRREALDALDARRDEPANVADDLLAEAVFGPTHPYGRIAAGTPQGIRSAATDSLHGFHQSYFRPEGSHLIVAGDFDVDRLPEFLEEAFAGWVGEVPAISRPPVSPSAWQMGERISHELPAASQTEIRLGSTGMERSSTDWIAGAVANYILGGSTITGRLGANLRESKGWTYGARSGFAAGLQPAGWSVETAVDAAVAGLATAEIRAEIESLRDVGPAEDELRRAQDALVLSLPRAFETPHRTVNRLSTVETFGLPEDYWRRFPDSVRAVTAREVRRIVARYMDPGALAEVIVG